MRIERRRYGDAAILDVFGKFSPGTDDLVAASVREATLDGCRAVILNLRQAVGPGTPAITALVRALGIARTAGRALMLVGVEPRLRQLLRIVALYPCFDVFDTEEQALASGHQRRSSPPLGRSDRSETCVA